MVENLEVFVDRLAADSTFRNAFREDPGEALSTVGIDIPEEALTDLGDLSITSDQELEERVSKWWLVWHGGW